MQLFLIFICIFILKFDTFMKFLLFLCFVDGVTKCLNFQLIFGVMVNKEGDLNLKSDCSDIIITVLLNPTFTISNFHYYYFIMTGLSKQAHQKNKNKKLESYGIIEPLNILNEMILLEYREQYGISRGFVCACGGVIGADDNRETSFDIVSCFLYLLFFVGS